MVSTQGDVAGSTVAAGVTRLLLEGPPRVGKSTIVGEVLRILARGDAAVRGIWTRALLGESGERVGFRVTALDSGRSGWMSHVDFPGEVRVGRYGVDVAGFERIALPALHAVAPGTIAIVDELGRAQLASDPFVQAVDRVLSLPCPTLLTVHVVDHPVTDRIKARGDLELLRVTPNNRDALAGRLVTRLRAHAM